MRTSVLPMVLLAALIAGPAVAAENPVVRITTSLGPVEVELYRDQAPATVENFLAYVKSNFYNGTIFHRVIPGFMIQGGGFTSGMQEKRTRVPIRNEANNGLKNQAGTIAMARTMDPHSATAQFFINTVDNPLLDHRNPTPQGWGYCVFGKVTKGMDIVKKIEQVRTGSRGPHQNVPQKDVVIRKIDVVSAAAPKTGKKSAEK